MGYYFDYIKDSGDFCNRLDYLAQKFRNKKVVIYGAGEFFSYINKHFDLSKINIIGITDKKFTLSDEGSLFEGYKIIPTEKLNSYAPDCLLISLKKAYSLENSIKEEFNIETEQLLKVDIKNVDIKNKFVARDKKIVVTGDAYGVATLLGLIDINLTNIVGVSLDDDPVPEILGYKNYSKKELSKLFLDKEADTILMSLLYKPLNSYLAIDEILKVNNIDEKNVYVATQTSIQRFKDQPNNENLQKLFAPASEFAELPVLKFLLTEHCNLNCAGCSHFAPLVKEKIFLSFEQYKKELDRIKELFDGVRLISLLGGEPLLNKDLKRMLLYAREQFPYADLEIISNGILMHTMDEEFYEIIKNTNTTVYLSKYATTAEIIDRVQADLERRSINYGVWSYKGFCKRYSLKANLDLKESFDGCKEKICHTLLNGKFASCYYPITVERANKFFDINIPWEDCVVDIYDESITGKQILEKFRKPMSICAHCGQWTPAPWIKSGKEPSLSEYFVDA